MKMMQLGIRTEIDFIISMKEREVYGRGHMDIRIFLPIFIIATSSVYDAAQTATKHDRWEFSKDEKIKFKAMVKMKSRLASMLVYLILDLGSHLSITHWN